MKNALFAAAAVAAALLSLPAMADQPSKDIKATLKIFQWVNPQIMDSTNRAIARFAERYPNVTIDAQYVPQPSWGQYNSSFLNQVASGDTPDIFASAIEGFAETSSKGLFVDLNGLTAKDPAAQKVLDGLDPNLLKGMRTRPTGELNFFPTEWNDIVMYYNKDMFDKAGLAYPNDKWTWQDFEDAAKKLTIKDAKGNVTQYGYVVPNFYFGITPWFYTDNAGILDDDWKKPTVTTAAFKETLKFLHDLIHVDKVAPAYDTEDPSNKFVSGQVAMLSSGHWPLPEIIKSGLKHVGVQIMPINKTMMTVFGIGGLGITKASKNPELAWEFVKEMTGDEYQKELADSQRSIPSARAFATTPQYLAFPDNAKLYYETAAYAKPVAAPPNYAQVEEITMRHIGAYMTDTEDLDTAISGLDSELSRAMKRAYR